MASFFGYGHKRGCHISWRPVLETCQGLKVYRQRRAARRIGAYAPRTMHIHEAPCIFTSGCSLGIRGTTLQRFRSRPSSYKGNRALPNTSSLDIVFLDRNLLVEEARSHLFVQILDFAKMNPATEKRRRLDVLGIGWSLVNRYEYFSRFFIISMIRYNFIKRVVAILRIK